MTPLYLWQSRRSGYRPTRQPSSPGKRPEVDIHSSRTEKRAGALGFRRPNWCSLGHTQGTCKYGTRKAVVGEVDQSGLHAFVPEVLHPGRTAGGRRGREHEPPLPETRVKSNSRTSFGPLTLGLTSLHPHAVVPSILSVEGQRNVLPAVFQRGRGIPDRTGPTFATAHPFVDQTEAREQAADQDISGAPSL